MDLKDLTPKSDTFEVALVHPNTNEPLMNPDDTPMTITMWAPHSKPYKDVLHQQTNKRLTQVSDGGSFELKSEDLEESTLQTLIHTTKMWNITFDGEKPPCTVEKCEEVYTEVFWMKTQIEKALTDFLNFSIA